MGPQQHRKAVDALYAALAIGDRAGVLSLLAVDFTGYGAAGMPLQLGGIYRGPDAMYDEFWAGIGRHFRVQAYAESVTELGEGVVLATGTYRGVVRSTGMSFEAAFTHRIRFAGESIVELHQLTDTAAWSGALTPRSSTVDYTIADGLATIALNRPDAKNGMAQDVADELYDIAQRIAHDAAVRAVLFTGNGKVFSVGGDITVLASTPAAELPEALGRMAGRYNDALLQFSRLTVPVVAAVHGAVAGGALGLIYVADIVLAAEGTKFATGFGKIGLTGDGGNSWFLPRLVGARRAAELYFEDRVLDAHEAVEWGLITRVVPASELVEEGSAVARKLASGPTLAYGAMRQLFRQSPTTALAQQLADEAAAVSRAGASRDAQRAFSGFVASQQPTFEGK